MNCARFWKAPRRVSSFIVRGICLRKCGAWEKALPSPLRESEAIGRLALRSLDNIARYCDDDVAIEAKYLTPRVQMADRDATSRRLCNRGNASLTQVQSRPHTGNPCRTLYL